MKLLIIDDNRALIRGLKDFLDKDFVIDSAETAKKGLKVSGFARFQLGEGIEKKKENFAEEVAAQLKK